MSRSRSHCLVWNSDISRYDFSICSLDNLFIFRSGGQCVEVMLRASGLRSNPSRITFLLLLMSRLLRCYVSCERPFPCLIKSRDLRRPVSSTLFSCLFYGFTSPSSVIFSWSRSLSCLSLALHYVSSFRSLRSTLVLIVIVGWAVGRAHGFGPVFSQGTNTTTSPAAVLFFSAMTSAIATKATLALNICVWSSQILLFQRLI